MMRSRTVLIGNGPDADASVLVDLLRPEGAFDVTVCVNPTPATIASMARTLRFAAVLLHVHTPDAFVGAVLDEIRLACPALSVIVVADEAREEEMVRALNRGATDFIIAPIRTAELNARLRAQLRNQERHEDAELTIGPYRFRPSTRMLHDPVRNARIRLTYKETEILKYLCRVGDQAVPRLTLLRDVWGYSHNVKSFTVESHIYRLRQKLERDPAAVRLLVNAKGGYRLRTDAIPDAI
jgi:DNA-binding response OmpR family regulator